MSNQEHEAAKSKRPGRGGQQSQPVLTQTAGLRIGTALRLRHGYAMAQQPTHTWPRCTLQSPGRQARRFAIEPRPRPISFTPLPDPALRARAPPHARTRRRAEGDDSTTMTSTPESSSSRTLGSTAMSRAKIRSSGRVPYAPNVSETSSSSARRVAADRLRRRSSGDGGRPHGGEGGEGAGGEGRGGL